MQIYRVVSTEVDNMPIYIPWLTLPSAVFENSAVSILVPLAAGMGVGLSVPSIRMKCVRVVTGAYIL